VLIAGLAGATLVSADDGRTFDYHQQPGRRGTAAVVQTADGSLLLVGEYGVRMTTLADLVAAAE